MVLKKKNDEIWFMKIGKFREEIRWSTEKEESYFGYIAFEYTCIYIQMYIYMFIHAYMWMKSSEKGLELQT